MLYLEQEFTVVITPSLQNELEKLDKTHVKIILKKFQKIRSNGLNTLKILRIRGNYLLCESKSRRPPYRLYVIVNQKKLVFYLVKWEHKKNQQKVIKELSGFLDEAFKYGLDRMIKEYFT